MPLASATKRLFASELQNIAARKPFAKISVAEICRSAGATRQTFYYHFRDKYDLAAWIYLQDLAESVGPTGSVDEESLRRMLQAMLRKRNFYRSAMEDVSQNGLLSYIQEFSYGFIFDALKGQYHLNPTNELHIAVSYHSYGMNLIIFDWLSGKLEATPEELANVLGRSTKHIVQDLAAPQQDAKRPSRDEGLGKR